jgi:hypothetical protein
MAWFQDLAECDYFRDGKPSLRAVGWLQRGKPFPLGAMRPEVYAALTELAKEPWQPSTFLGWHTCDLCLSDLPATGCQNVFIPGDGVIYVCPELVTHYMNVHGYQPPVCFCDAVLKCPPMGSTEYLRAILANGGRSLVEAANPAVVSIDTGGPAPGNRLDQEVKGHSRTKRRSRGNHAPDTLPRP